MFPAVGAIPDLISAAISAARGKWVDCVLSLIAAIPFVGDVVGAAKIGAKLAKGASKLALFVKDVVLKVLRAPPVKQIFDQMISVGKEVGCVPARLE